MGDEASLDDFFAKKDRSKKKSKGKMKQGDVLLPKLDDESTSTNNTVNTGTGNVSASVTPVQSKEKLQKKKDKDKNLGVGGQNTQAEEEEWIDFEEKTEKDYTGLRIQKLQITNRVESGNESDQKDGGDEDGDDDGTTRDEANQGPWNKSTTTPTEETTPVPDEKEKSQPAQTTKYVPPSMRNRSTQWTKKKKDAPDIKNEEEFPTLGTGPPPDWANQVKSFKPVPTSGRRVEVETKEDSSSLLLQNKFAALT